MIRITDSQKTSTSETGGSVSIFQRSGTMFIPPLHTKIPDTQKEAALKVCAQCSLFKPIRVQ